MLILPSSEQEHFKECWHWHSTLLRWQNLSISFDYLNWQTKKGGGFQGSKQTGISSIQTLKT